MISLSELSPVYGEFEVHQHFIILKTMWFFNLNGLFYISRCSLKKRTNHQYDYYETEFALMLPPTGEYIFYHSIE